MTLRLFPALPGIVYPVKRTPLWSTDKQVSVSGKVSALARWTYPRYGIEVGYEFLRMDTAWREYQDLVAFYNLASGGAGLFRFNDPNYNTATLQGIGVGDGTTVAFQLLASIAGPNFSWIDPVFYPVTSQIFINGVLKATPADYSISTTGLVTFTTPPAVGALLTWTGTFQWLVRFDDDSSTFEQFTYNLVENKKISFTSEKI